MLGCAHQDRLLNLPHPFADLQLVLGIALGCLRTSTHHCSLGSRSSCIQTLSGMPSPPESRLISTKPLPRQKASAMVLPSRYEIRICEWTPIPEATIDSTNAEPIPFPWYSGST